MDISLLFWLMPILGFILLFFRKFRIVGVILLVGPIALILFVFLWGCGAD